MARRASIAFRTAGRISEGSSTEFADCLLATSVAVAIVIWVALSFEITVP